MWLSPRQGIVKQKWCMFVWLFVRPSKLSVYLYIHCLFVYPPYCLLIRSYHFLLSVHPTGCCLSIPLLSVHKSQCLLSVYPIVCFSFNPHNCLFVTSHWLFVNPTLPFSSHPDGFCYSIQLFIPRFNQIILSVHPLFLLVCPSHLSLGLLCLTVCLLIQPHCLFIESSQCLLLSVHHHCLSIPICFFCPSPMLFHPAVCCCQASPIILLSIQSHYFSACLSATPPYYLAVHPALNLLWSVAYFSDH